jgi:DnaJ-class molecular chaperone
MAEYKCSRCDGEGRLWIHANVLGGVCFKCHGTGKQESKPAAKGVMWAVLDSNGVCAYNQKATTKAKAVAKSLKTYARASAAFQAEHDMTKATAVPYDEYWTQDRIDAAHAYVNS